jgi:hypothetical protein
MRRRNRKRSIGYALLVGLASTVLGQSQGDLGTADDLKAAMHDVLQHNNLLDSAYLSDRLGLGLRVHVIHETTGSDGTHYEGIPTTSPPALYGFLEYEARVDSARQTSDARLRLTSRFCPPLKDWGSEWNLPARSGRATDGGPGYAYLVWSSPDGITLTVMGGLVGCEFELIQRFKRVVSVPLSPALLQGPVDPLLNQIGALLHADLRNFSQVGRILGTEFVLPTEAQHEGLLYFGGALPSRVVVGFMPYVVYYANETGWYEPASFTARPYHIDDPGVSLNLSPDTTAACLSPAQLESGLARQDGGIRPQRPQSADEPMYFIRGVNLVTLTVDFADGCARSLSFRQLTNVDNSLGAPMTFTPENSLDRSGRGLSAEARGRIHRLAERVRTVTLRGMAVEEVDEKRPRPERRRDLAQLKRLLQNALKQEHIAQPPEDKTEPAMCDARRPGICVDVWR